MTSIQQKYQKKSDKEHVLDNPSTYTGSMEPTDLKTYIFKTDNIVMADLEGIIMGLYKLFDEAIVNCRDHVVRMKKIFESDKDNHYKVSTISITISDEGIITVTNDGDGIDIEKHPEYQLWIPEMIFYHLRTGTNYDKDEEKILGGQNGFGAKLLFIWSEWGCIETVDHTRKKKYIQECKNNLDVIEKPKITKCSNKPYTKISFKPDYKRLGIKHLSKDMMNLFRRRVYDIAAVTDKTVKVKLDNKVIPIKHFQQYVDLYIGDKQTTKRIYEEYSDRWEYIVCLSPTEEFSQVSFVNGIYTSKGGKHVDMIMSQIIKKIQAYILKKKKIEVKPTTIKEQLMLFLRCDIVNPLFDSQTKDYMSTPQNKFGSQCKVSDQFCEKIAKLGVMEAACELTAVKDKKSAKKTDGSKSKSIRGIPKLVDANWAGTAKSSHCSLILCEGDSAKAGIVSGLTRDDRNKIGIYPMRGKLFNVRGQSIKKIIENKEIIEIKKILGLETNKEYKTIEEIEKSLRYKMIIFMTDQDLDGSHIKGLGINLFQSQWNSLIDLGIIGFMNTPIVKATKGKTVKQFYNDGEYQEWLSNEATTGWKIKYYKGLGTSTSNEFKEYFANKKIVTFKNTNSCANSIDMVFNKQRADDRKNWLGDYDRNSYLDTSKESVTYTEFIQKEFIHFSKYDCDRSIANMIDGLKISNRKILYGAKKKKLTTDIKVAQFSGYVSEHSAYHHGEQSLNGAIVNMAQDFVGSNNINLLVPNGQFGTRLQGGKDSASERYIFTRLNKITNMIYSEKDVSILKHLEDDGLSVEPIYYLPIIPMILVNGATGIGTGFSQDILSYNPLELIAAIKDLCNGKVIKDNRLMPYYEGFTGEIKQIAANKYLILGKYEKTNKKDQIKITELPVGVWTEDYKKYLEVLVEKKTIRDYNDLSTDKLVEFIVTFNKDVIKKLESKKGDYDRNSLEKIMKLYTTKMTSNMYAFNDKEQLKKYTTPEEIIREYFEVRKEGYKKRKENLIKELGDLVNILNNKARYLKEILDDTIDLRRKKSKDIDKLLKDKKYDMQDGSYKYLRGMTMDMVSEENVKSIMSQSRNKENELKKLKATTIVNMWLEDLMQLEKALVVE